MIELVISNSAENDIDSIAAYIAQDNPTRAVTFIAEIRAKFLEIAERPNSFPEKALWRKGKRSAITGKYHIIFEIKPTVIEIDRILHGARNIPEIL
ncbi:type II toxin-antitoxin system RelE/ParE family toxin [Sphingorhabdus sp. IMCC26285]|uniref:Type II toxin-antitoxin system RelE/ParE family toxin n=1 Tax=Sphingorhabdus profundilacus TaxID=2509718 RepID=A0A6I4M438_9SPHN|nr:type II toxin-antitoxin system RelE/ParE family toxin [Sphingorhabdus profundilacus]MVZ97095.1 type II toxin-antitoxin system RelE/ParE family toxin [Sphingorhabdus profundilacus]